MRVLLILLLGASAVMHGAANPGGDKAGAKAAAPKPDAAIEADLRARLARSKVGKNGFEVRVRGGVATITGRASVPQHKGVVTRMAKLAGATRVVNQIEISEAAREQAAARLAKAREAREKIDRNTKAGAPAVRAEVAGAGLAPGVTPGHDLRSASEQPPPPRPRRVTVRHP